MYEYKLFRTFFVLTCIVLLLTYFAFNFDAVRDRSHDLISACISNHFDSNVAFSYI